MVKTRLTAEEFFALPLERGELVDGEVREERPPKPEHGRIALRIGYHLMRWLEETGRGVAGVEGGFVLRRDPDRVRSPDVWFLSHERLKEVTREGFYEGAPDLAVEVVSPGEASSRPRGSGRRRGPTGLPVALGGPFRPVSLGSAL